MKLNFSLKLKTKCSTTTICANSFLFLTSEKWNNWGGLFVVYLDIWVFVRPTLAGWLHSRRFDMSHSHRNWTIYKWWGHLSGVQDERINMRKDVLSYNYVKFVLFILLNRVLFFYLAMFLSSLVSYPLWGKSCEPCKPIKTTVNKSCKVM